MKKGVVFSVSLALVLAFCLPAFAQPNSRSVETISIDNFDTPDSVDWTWNVQGSRFITDGYPKLQYVEAIPNALRPLHKDDTTPQVLGIKTAFDRKGENWFEIFPSLKSEGSSSEESEGPKNYEIPFEGVVSQVDFWVWGANYRYYLQMLVRDVDGVVHVLDVCDLSFSGWKNVVVKIPTTIRQNSRLRSAPATMKFIGFRVRTDANEYVDDFNIFFDDLKYTTNVLSNIYDGYDLNHFDFGEDSSSTKSSTEEGK